MEMPPHMRQVPDHLKKMRVGLRKQKPVGTTSPDPAQIIAWDDQQPPIIVVTQILPKQPEGTQLWALLYPKDGLCKPVGIAQDIVFYAYEYRDATTDSSKRAPSWNRKVAIHAIRPSLSPPLTQKQHKFKYAKDSTKLVFSPNISLANEVASLVASYAHTPDKSFLDEVKSVLKEID